MRINFAALVIFTAFIGWLWVCAAFDKPYRLFHSTDRYCSYIGFVNGRFVFHYDGGADQGLVKKRDWQFLGVFCKSGATGGRGSWQELDVGLHGWFAVAFLSIAWPLSAWHFIGVPLLRRKYGRCVRCGYDLRDIPSPVCPECGLTIPPKASNTPVQPESGSDTA